MELVNKNVAGPKPEIGRIDLMPGYTLFDVRKGDSKRVLDALRHAEFFGDRIHAEVAEEGRDYAGNVLVYQLHKVAGEETRRWR